MDHVISTISAAKIAVLSAQAAQAQDVVSNDKKANAAVVAAPAANSNTGMPVEDLITIRKDHDEWVDGAYARSNAALYTLMARCLDAYQRMVGKPAQITAFHSECDRAGLSFKKSTGVLQRIVSYVFAGAGRRRTSALPFTVIFSPYAASTTFTVASSVTKPITSSEPSEVVRANAATNLVTLQACRAWHLRSP